MILVKIVRIVEMVMIVGIVRIVKAVKSAIMGWMVRIDKFIMKVTKDCIG